MARLAIQGGQPVGRFSVPAWPQPGPNALDNLRAVLASRRWSVSGPWLGGPSAEARFAAHFAEFIGAPYCVPTTNGTSALTTALEAVGVGAGDEVVIPGLTWVANATAVLAVNATPVMVDIDPSTLCLSPAAVEAAVNERTKAITVVHLYSSIADLDAILTIGERHGIPVIEDCAHAHGASWRGRRVGTWGAAGTFSMQQRKLLTAGEGGAVVCRDGDLFDRLYQLRADGRRATPNPVHGEWELVFDGSVTGANHCMPELVAALLDDQLTALPEQNRRRAENAATVDEILAPLSGVAPVSVLPPVTERTYYHYAARIDRAAFGGVTAATVCRALEAETGLPFHPSHPPLHRHPLYRPHANRRFLIEGRAPDRLDGPVGGTPEAERAHLEVLTLHHAVLLAPDGAFEALPAAIEKLQQETGDLRSSEPADAQPFRPSPGDTAPRRRPHSARSEVR
jgi:L-glutamine:2-deoxy-scyllo-inosose/3-amino-2,3-dideoxy-scyllo-inosose aminotransferase